jgi:hypothetical protein
MSSGRARKRHGASSHARSFAWALRARNAIVKSDTESTRGRHTRLYAPGVDASSEL